MDADDDVVAVRLRLNTRHPVFDICDFFADADMYGLGKGVYPKDKAPPIPLHPHCMCRLEEVFSWEIDISKAKNQVKQAGDKWLSGLSDRERREVLGIAGDKAWQDGESWEKYLRNWKGLAKPETRLKEEVATAQIEESVGQSICKLDTSIYSCVTKDIRTNEVIITNERIEHIKERHPNDYERFKAYIPQIIRQPDYILEANKPNTAFILKTIEDKNEHFQLILRLATSDDPQENKNSVITFLKVNERKYNKYLRNKKILYSRGDEDV